MTRPPVTEVIDRLLDSDVPALAWKTRVHVLGEPPESLRALQGEIAGSLLVQRLLAKQADSNVYRKWQGLHWVLATLADLGYPPGDPRLAPMRERVLDFWLADSYFKDFEATSKAQAYSKRGVPVMDGRHRRCASQQGNALFFLHRLGLADERCDLLVERLLHWQWPDGGWNCDREPRAVNSSFFETLLPMRGLAAHAAAAGDARAGEAARRSAEVFLARRLFKRRRDGGVIHPDFTALHYPLYWHYDILGGLKALADVELLGDLRCADALDLLESKRLPDGGWPAEEKHYSVSSELTLHADWVDWGGTSSKRLNPWVTVDALAVLAKAGRLVAG